MRLIKEKILNNIVSAITEKGYIVIENFLPNTILNPLQQQVQSLTDNNLKKAAVGRGELLQNNEDIRRDKINWLDKSKQADNLYLEWMEQLRVALNQKLFLGLFDYECHYSIYQQGDFYKKHRDALKGKTNRKLSTVFYLNEQWNIDSGGELILFDTDGKTILEKIIPNTGKLVIFLSEKFPHEVLTTKQTRYSIAGWFRVNASNSQSVDTLY